MKRLLFTLCISFFFLSCGEFSLKEKKEIESVLALNEERALRKHETSLIPILNEVAAKPIELKAEQQEGNNLTLQFDIDLEPDEELHFSVNNGPVSKAKGPEIAVELLEGNNVIFVCLSNIVGVSSTFWVKNYFNGEGNGSFDESRMHLFQHITANKEGIVVDYQILNNTEGTKVAIQIDNLSFDLEAYTPYLLKQNTSLRLQLLDSDGELIDGPFNDTGVIEVKIN